MKKSDFFLNCIFIILIFFCSAAVISADSEIKSITVNYSNVTDVLQTITVDYCDDWFLQPDNVYNHKLMQASFAMAVSGFRSKVYELGELDHDILDFFQKAGFTDPQSDDFNKPTGINTIGTLIAHKKLGESVLIGVSISGNNYQNEWLSNLTIENDIRPKGFNNAAHTVMERVKKYIKDHNLSGDLRLWVAGYSRAAAVSNLFAADAVESHQFGGVYAYTFATPRTTREAHPKRYTNIYNMINPEDVVPMIPFPEWGYERYGTDLFLPSISTDSHYNELYIKAGEKADFDTENLPLFNPRMRRQLHTVLDYIAYFVNSVNTYTRSIQSLLLKFWQDKDVKALISSSIQNVDFEDILQSIEEQRPGYSNRLYEIYHFIDFNAQVIFKSFMASKFGSDDDYWDNGLSLQENVAFGHYDKSYRFWLFASDDPDELFTEDPAYLHMSIVGNVDVEVLDEKGDFIQQFDHEGWFITETDEKYNPDFHGGVSQTILYMERNGNQTMIELPCDQEKYTVYIKSNADQDIQVSVMEYSAQRLKADVLYIYEDHYAKGEGYPEMIEPAKERLVTTEQLIAEDVLSAHGPWDNDTDYSPTKVMLMENAGAFLKKSVTVIIILQLILMQLLGLLVIALMFALQRLIRFARKKITGKEIAINPDPLEIPEAKKMKMIRSNI
ncbi:MAG: hypothetical protein II969_05730 [Anaerolineaceae bacterium]|nr:hypothetical protein [Anaerolineaceae bacterium]